MAGMSAKMIIEFAVVLIAALGITSYTVGLMWDELLAAICSRWGSKPSSSSN
jgi:hypothetical protein